MSKESGVFPVTVRITPEIDASVGSITAEMVEANTITSEKLAANTMRLTRTINPDEHFVEVDGEELTLRQLAANRDELRAADFGSGEPEARAARTTAPLENLEVRDSGAGDGQFTIRGHASVFDRLSHELGGFREKVDRHAFDDVLDRDPDVHAVWDHNTTKVLGRTRNKTLELRVDPQGLHFWARVAPTSYAADLRVLMERGDVDQASFAFTVEEDEWHIDDEDNITRTIRRIGELFDVTVTAQGAYPQTDSQVVRGRPSGETATVVAEETPGDLTPVAEETQGEATSLNPEGEQSDRVAELKIRARKAKAAAHASRR